MSTIDKLVRGSIDMHIHFGPDPRVERRVDALQAALQAQEMGMRAIVLKCHEMPTAQVASVVGQFARNITVFGALSLDEEVGGLNPSAVEASAKVGAKVLWMPTFSAAGERQFQKKPGGISLYSDGGGLRPEVGQIIDLVKKYDMVLCTGHISTKESFDLVEEGRRRGLTKMVVTHPLQGAVMAGMSLEEQKQLAEKGAFIEHCFLAVLPLGGRRDPKELAEAFKTVGAEHCILSTDLGQAFNPAPAEGMRMAIATMLQCGLSEHEIELLVKVNPAKLLGLD
ncbi:MAG: DUF6282 family protein [Chloroflexota bacterium]|nr:DUF6282 family protein [Chloroflexota bacterium]